MKSQRRVEIDVGAVPRGLHLLAVVEQDGVRVPILVLARFGRLSQSAPAMHERLLEPLIDRTHRIAVAQMPLAEHAGGVACPGQQLGERGLIRVHHRATDVGVDTARAVVVATGHQAGPRGRTHGTDVEGRHGRTALGHRVDIGRLDGLVPGGPEIADALIVGHDQDDIRPLRCNSDAGDSRHRHAQQKATESCRHRNNPLRATVAFTHLCRLAHYRPMKLAAVDVVT